MKVFVHTLLKEENKQFLRNNLPDGMEAVFVDEIKEPVRREEFRGAVYTYGNPPADWLEKEGIALRWMQLYSAGFDPYQGLRRPIPVSNMHGYFAQPCAETVVAGILALYRKIDELTLLKERKEWTGGALRPKMQLLRDKRAVLLGAGTIAMAIGEILAGFRCQVSFYARTHSAASIRSKEALLEHLPATDLLINTLPGTAETTKLVSGPVLRALPASAVFANIGRGSTVDEQALIEALQSRQIGGAVLDVYEEEPLPPDSPLWDCPNTILTQHTGGGWMDEERGKVAFFLENLQRVLKGEEPLNLVDLEKGY